MPSPPEIVLISMEFFSIISYFLFIVVMASKTFYLHIYFILKRVVEWLSVRRPRPLNVVLLAGGYSVLSSTDPDICDRERGQKIDTG